MELIAMDKESWAMENTQGPGRPAPITILPIGMIMSGSIACKTIESNWFNKWSHPKTAPFQTYTGVLAVQTIPF